MDTEAIPVLDRYKTSETLLGIETLYLLFVRIYFLGYKTSETLLGIETFTSDR